jgi:UDP-galactose-lipid carrier transferase
MSYINAKTESLTYDGPSAAATIHSGSAITASRTGSIVKRAADLLGAAFLIAVAALPMAVISLVIAASGQSPVFGHKRVGLNGKTFRCLKFRTMVNDAEAALKRHLDQNPAAAEEWAEHRKLVNDPRITRIGRFLRETSLDEIPQLFNVLRGEMSLVGPRPVTEEELVRYRTAVSSYLSIRPGITGLWQVSGRNDISYDRRVSLDAFYAANANLFLDAKILFQTVGVVLLRRGAR